MTERYSNSLTHFGVKGMRWGVRKAEDNIYRTSSPDTVTVDAGIHGSTAAAGKEVATLIGQRYGLKIDAIKTIPADHPERKEGIMAYVERTDGGQKASTINVVETDVRARLSKGEQNGFFAKGCGNTKALLTHEAGHAIFHADEKVVNGFFGSKVVGGHSKERDKALAAALKAAKKDGIPMHMFASSISGYARQANCREEVEAEMFSQYHWGSDPPRFIKVWGETLHQEMGLDPTPFRKKVR